MHDRAAPRGAARRDARQGRRARSPRAWRLSGSEAERLLYFGLVGAIEAGLVRTAEDVLTVLRQASQPFGTIGEEWLTRQERELDEQR